MKEIYFFKEQVKETDEGTEIIISFLQNKYPNDTFTNVELEKEYQKKDIDYICEHNAKIYGLEIKVDSYLTNNLFYEFFSNFELKTQGCFEKTEADFIAYYYSKRDILYIINPNELRKYVHRYQKWLTPKYVPNSTYESMGYIIPLSDLGKNIVLAKFENISKNIDTYQKL